jgi:hypothetical protein
VNEQPKSIWRTEILPNNPVLKLLNNTFRWVFSKRGLRRLLIVLAWVVTLIALFYGEENWRGRHAWNQYRQGLEARGELLDLKSFIPKPVPDEQNFAATPFLKSWFMKKDPAQDYGNWNDDYASASRMVKPFDSEHIEGMGGRRQFLDLVAWAMAFDAVRAGQTNSHAEFKSDKLDLESRYGAAPIVLQGMKSSEAYLAELRSASQRPRSVYPVIYDLDNPWGILLPHLARIKAGCLRLQLLACAELALGQSEKALADLHLACYLADSLREEPFLISYLVRVACAKLATQVVWEGLAQNKWSDSQLQDIQALMLKYDFFKDLKRPLAAERAAGVLTCDLLARGTYRPTMLAGAPSDGSPPTPQFADLVARILPRGWYRFEQLNYCRLHEQLLPHSTDTAANKVDPSQIAEAAKSFERELAGSAGTGKTFQGMVVHHRVVAALLLPALGNLQRKAAEGQTTTDEAALACALERFRLAKGKFPESLEELTPALVSQLPHDLITGKPYTYRRSPDGGYLLYSVGWDQKDDGGVPGKTMFDEKHGDWVWQYSAK